MTTKVAGNDAMMSLIREHPFAAGLEPGHLETISSLAMRKNFRAGELIMAEGDPANRFYLIRKGRVALGSRKPGEKPVVIQEIGAGDVLGWSWLIAPYEVHFDAWAVEATEAIFFYGTRLREECDEDPSLGYSLLQRVTETVLTRLQATRRKLINKLRTEN